MITGRIKFFKRSVALPSKGASVSASDSSAATVILNESPGSSWISSEAGSITLDIGFLQSRINRVLILDHNLKDFTITSSQSFDSVKDINNDDLPDGNIAVTGNEKNSSYFAFDLIPNISSIQITINDTFDGSTKKIGRVILCEEFGTLKGYPEIGEIRFTQNSRDVKSKGGAQLITKQNDTLKSVPLNFRNYTEISDLQLMRDLETSADSFLVWLCGGDEEQFFIPFEGLRLQDIYKMQTKGDFKQRPVKGSYAAPVDAKITLVEAV